MTTEDIQVYILYDSGISMICISFSKLVERLLVYSFKLLLLILCLDCFSTHRFVRKPQRKYYFCLD